MKKILFIVVFLVVFIKLTYCQGDVFTVEVAQKEISLISKPYDVYFDVQFQVVNTGGREQTIYLWSCSDGGNWKADNSLVIESGPICRQNILLPKLLKPGEKLNQKVTFRILEKGYSGDITFRAGFRVIKNPSDYDTEKEEVYWSSPITVKVRPASPVPK